MSNEASRDDIWLHIHSKKKNEIATKTIVRTKHKLRKFVRQSLYCVVKCIFVVVERERDSTVGGCFFKMVVGASPPDAILISRWPPLVVCRLRSAGNARRGNLVLLWNYTHAQR